MMKEGGDNRKEGKGEESDDWVNELFGDVTSNISTTRTKRPESVQRQRTHSGGAGCSNCLLQHDYCTKEEVCKAGGAEIQPSEQKTVKPLGHKSKPKKDLEVSFQEANDRREMHQFEELIKASSATEGSQRRWTRRLWSRK
jgi:hypothetical protein